MSLRSRMKELEERLNNQGKAIVDIRIKYSNLRMRIDQKEWEENNKPLYQIGTFIDGSKIIESYIQRNRCSNDADITFNRTYRVINSNYKKETVTESQFIERLKNREEMSNKPIIEDSKRNSIKQTGFMHIGELMREIFPADESEGSQGKDIVLDALKGARALFQAQGNHTGFRIGGEQYTAILKAIEELEN